MRPGEEQRPGNVPTYGLFQIHSAAHVVDTGVSTSVTDAAHELATVVNPWFSGEGGDFRDAMSLSPGDTDAIFEEVDKKISDFANQNGEDHNDTGDFDCDQALTALEIEDEAADTGLSRRVLFEGLRKSFGKSLQNAKVDVTAADTITFDSVADSNDKVTHVDNGEISRRGLVLGLVAAGVSVYAVNTLKDWSPFKERASELFKTQPPDVTVEQMHETIEVRGTFEMLAIADVTMGVEVNGFKEGLGLDVLGITDAEFKKDLWMRMALTTDNKQINDSLVVTKERTKDGEKVLGVRATLNAADIFMPHYDLFNFLNFVSLRPGDSAEERAKKIYEFATKNGKHYDETGGFDCTACSVSSAELFNASILGAMYAVSLDGRQPDLVDRMTKRYQLNLQTQLASQYGLPLENVQIDIAYDEGSNPLAPPTPEQVKAIYQSRLDEIYQQYYENVTIEYEGVEQQVDIGKVVFEVKPELRYDDNNEPYAYLRLHGGAEITIKLGGITLEEDVRSMIISNIDEFEEKVINNPSAEAKTTIAPNAQQPNQIVTTSTQPLVGPPFNSQPVQPTPTTEAIVYGPVWTGNTTTTQG